MGKIIAPGTQDVGTHEAGLELSYRFSFLPWLALSIGGVVGRVAAGVPALTEPEKTVLGPDLGAILTSADALILCFGLVGVFISYLWLRRGNPKGKAE